MKRELFIHYLAWINWNYGWWYNNISKGGSLAAMGTAEWPFSLPLADHWTSRDSQRSFQLSSGYVPSRSWGSDQRQHPLRSGNSRSTFSNIEWSYSLKEKWNGWLESMNVPRRNKKIAGTMDSWQNIQIEEKTEVLVFRIWHKEQGSSSINFTSLLRRRLRSKRRPAQLMAADLKSK